MEPKGFFSTKWGALLMLHLLLLVYSFNGLFLKIAAQQPWLSVAFCMWFCLSLGTLGFMALGWQQVLKRLSLFTAYANRPVVFIWSILWAFLFLNECRNWSWVTVLGVCFILGGVWTVITARE